MADASRLWIGGAATTAQIDTVQLAGTWAGDGNITTTMTAEDGTTQTVVTAAVAGSTTTNRDNHLANLQADTQSLFAAVTWASSSTDSFTGTAKTAGVPFYQATTEGDSTGSVASDTTTTANTGPNDWSTPGNWEGSSIPGDDDRVYINQGSYSILYGLRPNSSGTQGGTAVALQAFRVGPQYRGTIGQNLNGYYLQIDVDNTATIANPVVSFKGRGNGCWLLGNFGSVYVSGGAAGPNMFRLSTDEALDNLYISGTPIEGTVQIAAASILGSIRISEAPGVTVVIGENATSFSLLKMNSGKVQTKTGATTVDVHGGELELHKDMDDTITALEVTGGICRINGSGAITDIFQYGGLVTLDDNQASGITLSNVNVYGGTFSEQGAQSNVTYSANIIRHGGVVNVDSGNTITPST